MCVIAWLVSPKQKRCSFYFLWQVWFSYTIEGHTQKVPIRLNYLSVTNHGRYPFSLYVTCRLITGSVGDTWPLSPHYVSQNITTPQNPYLLGDDTPYLAPLINTKASLLKCCLIARNSSILSRQAPPLHDYFRFMECFEKQHIKFHDVWGYFVMKDFHALILLFLSLPDDVRHPSRQRLPMTWTPLPVFANISRQFCFLLE